MVKPHTSDSHTPTTLRKYHRTASAAAAVPPTSSTFLLHSMGNAFWQVFPSIDWWTKPIFHWNQIPNLESNRVLNLNPNNSMSSGGLMVAVSKLLKLKLWKEVMAAHILGLYYHANIKPEPSSTSTQNKHFFVVVKIPNQQTIQWYGPIRVPQNPWTRFHRHPYKTTTLHLQ